jgi:hypothetical protein
MQIRKYLGLAVFPFFFAFSPSLFAVSYAWNFTGSGGTNCPITSGRNSCADPGNSMTFTTPGGPKVTVTAWYLDGKGKLQSATLGQYSSGLGVCYASENCSGSNQELDNNSESEFLLFQFSAPVDPTSITLNSPSKDKLGASYWLGSTINPSINLTNMNMTTSLSTLGFGSQNNSNAGTGSTRTIDFGGTPSTSVNAVLFSAMYGYSGDNFDIGSIYGTAVAASVPEPASIFLLFTVIVAGSRMRGGRRVLR